MGRWSTGATTTGRCLRIEIKMFLPYLKNEQECSTTITWTSGASIVYNLFYNGFSATLNLRYIRTNQDEIKETINYNIIILSKPSNLGKGRIYYFLCPFKGKLCKILYMGYGSLYFKSREAYGHRIYYSSQLSSHLDRHNDTYWRLERKLEELYKKHLKSHYRGQKTVIKQRMEVMEQKESTMII